MHYRHSFHAGNFADVFKHLLLVGLLQALSRKDKPWFFLDTHAGAGLYSLQSLDAARTAEWQSGVGQLASLQSQTEPLATYLASLRSFSPSLSAAYAGSPLLALSLARSGDRLAFCEKQAPILDSLRDALDQSDSTAIRAIHLRDGYEAASLLPPAEKRALVLIDPPFERADEFDAIVAFLKLAQGRFLQGQYAVWYPVKKRFDADRFARRIGAASARPVLDLRLDNGAASEGQMHACGMVVVNPPYRFAEDVRASLETLRSALAQGPTAAVETRWIKTEEQCKT